MVQNLLKANHQWRNRPVDGRFHNLENLKHAVLNRRNISFEGIVETGTLRVTPIEDSLALMHDAQSLALTNFGRLVSYVILPVPLHHIYEPCHQSL